MGKAKTTEEFIKEAKQIHGDKYDYSKTIYVTNHDKVCIICPEHGEFWQTPIQHLKTYGCAKCGRSIGGRKNRSSTEKFIETAKKIHGDRYDYSKVNYINNLTKVIITCPEHGDFEQTPAQHLNGRGCYKCGISKSALEKSKSTIQFINDAKKVHGNKYDYSKVDYINNKSKVIIICPIHGEFEQVAGSHLSGCGCKKCASDSKKLTLKEFVERSKEVHNNKYSYDKSKYIDLFTKIIITCPKHGDFEQEPANHLRGAGCPKCYSRKQQTILFNKIKSDLNINLQFDAHTDWLGKQSLDIYSSEYNFAIEYNGIQHYEPIDYFGGQSAFEYRCKLDQNKKELCKNNKCKLFVLKYDYTEEDYINLINKLKNIIYGGSCC